MKKISYRAWLPKTKKMVYDIEEDDDFSDIVYEHNTDKSLYILMQNTNLKDINNNEIYEDDIVKIYGTDKSIVKYDERFSGFILVPYGSEFYFDNPMLGCNIKNVEVIGNLYQELIDENNSI